jgi:hypothetical protein
MTPIFSAYVVVPMSPKRLAMTVEAPSPMIDLPRNGSRFSPVIAATAFT